MAYVRKPSSTRRRGAPKRRGTRMSGGRFTTRTSYARTPVRRVARPRPQRRVPTPFNAFALAHVDPFDDRCRGIKIPDANTMPSVGLTISQETTMVVTGTQANAHAFFPSVGCMEILAGDKNVGSNSWTWYLTGAPTSTAIQPTQQTQSLKFGAVVAGYDLVRSVAHGVRLSCGLAPQTVTGFAHIAICSRPTVNNYVATWWPASVAEMAECVWYKRVPLATLTQRPLTVVNKILDTTSQTYHSPVRAYTSESDPVSGLAAAQAMATGGAPTGTTPFGYFDRDSLNGFAAIIVAVEGAPSGSSPLVIEMITHIEAIPRATGLQTGSLAAPSNPAVLAGVSHMAATTPAEHFEGEEPSRIAQAANAFYQGASTAVGGTVTSLGNTFVSAAGHAGYAAASYAMNRAAGSAWGDVPGVGSANRLLN